jgi:hypothetical protein
LSRLRALLPRLLGLCARISAELWLALALAAVAFGIAFSFEMFFLKYPGPVGFDDGYILAMGERLIDERWLPYVDSYDIRGPLLHWTVAVTELVSGRFDWRAARVLSIGLSFSTLLSLFGIGLAARKPFAGAIAMLTYVCVVMGNLQYGGSFSLTGERVASPYAAAALLLTTLALDEGRRPAARRWQLVVAGACAALAGLAKQTCLPCVVPLGVWTVATALARPDLPRRERMSLPVALLLGFAGVIGLTLLRYAIHGELGRFWYWYYRYSAEAYMKPYSVRDAVAYVEGFAREYTWGVLALVMILVTSLSRPLLAAGPSLRALARGYCAVGLEVTTALLGLLLFASALAPLRLWPHYFVCALLFLSLLVGFRTHQFLFARQSGRRIAAQALSGVLFAAFAVGSTRLTLETLVSSRRQGKWGPPTPEPICAEFDRHARPGESVFVWGFNADLYITCRRHPATRFTVLTFVAGTIPPFWEVVHEEFVSRHGREELISDLERERPPVILDMGDNMGDIQMLEVPMVGPFLSAHYCQGSKVTAKDGRTGEVWVRNDLPACRATRATP